MTLPERLLIAAPLALLVLGLGVLSRRRGLPRPPLLVMLMGLLAWALLQNIPTPAGLRWLAAAGDLGLAYGLIGLTVWLVMECPPALGWWPLQARIVRDLLRFGLAALATVLVLQTKTQLNLVGLVTTSAVLTAVLGLAAQEPLKDLFAGIELQVDPPFRVGDWISTGESSGVVESLNMLNTTLRCLDNSTLKVPNSKVVDAPLRRFSSHEPAGNRFSLGLGYEIPPGQARALLEQALHRHPLVLKDPAPSVWIANFADSWISYELLVYHRKGTERVRLRIRSELLEQIWYMLERHGWSVPYPALQLQPRPKAAEATRRDAEATSAELRRSWLFSQLDPAQVESLAARVRWIRYGPGETIVREGDTGTALYQVAAGSVEVLKDDGTPQGLAVARLDRNELFGEMSLFTGSPRSATVRSLGEAVLLEVNRQDLLPTLENDPSLLEQLSLIVASRRSELERLSSQESVVNRASLLRRMQDLFFGLGGEGRA